jgi:CheY-like chemotaxis protein
MLRIACLAGHICVWSGIGLPAMANILLIDDSELAIRAMKGILARGSHRLATAATSEEAWQFVLANVKIDLVFAEIKLKGDSGLAFVQRVRRDPLLKLMPVVIYTAQADRNAVKEALTLKVQNYLVKPYHDDSIYAEIAKTALNPWRNRHFEEEKSFCTLMGYRPEDLHKLLESLRTALDEVRPEFRQCAEIRHGEKALEKLTELGTQAEAAGAWGAVDLLTEMRGRVEREEWEDFVNAEACLVFAGRLITAHLNPTVIPDGFLSGTEQDAQQVAREKALWFDAATQNRCPVVPLKQVLRQLEALPACPVVDSVAASFQMHANGTRSSLNPLMDIVERDPALATQVLIAANHLPRSEEAAMTAVEDPRQAVSMLGEVRLASLASSVITIEERLMQAPPFSWPSFWMFQIAVARMAHYTAIYLEFDNVEPKAYAAGLLHDFGKLLLFRLYPYGFQAALAHAQDCRVPLPVAEKLFFDCTSREVAVHFAEHQGLPKPFCNIMRWVGTPEEATEDVELVAVVALARDLCLANHVGHCGEKLNEQAPPLEETSAWRVLRASVFPSFNLKKFETRVHAECLELKQELHGRMGGRATYGRLTAQKTDAVVAGEPSRS